MVNCTRHNYDLSPDIVISHKQLDITQTFPLLGQAGLTCIPPPWRL